MGFFETVKGQNVMESIASSMERIASALEKNNQLIAKVLQSEYSEEFIKPNGNGD